MAAAPNELLKDIHTLVEETVEETDQASGFSKSLPSFGMGDIEGQRQQDVEYLPEDFRFESQEGYQSKADNTDSQGLTDRLIPIRRKTSRYIKTHITTEELRDPRLRTMASKGFSREIRNTVDAYSYRKAIQRASMTVASNTDITQADFSAAEVLMIDSGLSQYQKNVFLSIPHYKKLSDKLALNQYHPGVPQSAYTKGEIPSMIAGFDKAWRADYRITLPEAAATGLTVKGDQKHTVVTRIDDVPVDNRQMALTITGSNTTVKPGDKLTIEGVYRLNPEVREDTGELMTFTVVQVPASPTDQLVISPAIIVDGPYRNCTAQAGDGMGITFINLKKNNPSLFWAQDSIKLIPGRLPVNGGGVEKVEAVSEQGLPFRFTYWYDPDDEVMYMKAVVYFDCEVWLPSQVGVVLDQQTA